MFALRACSAALVLASLTSVATASSDAPRELVVDAAISQLPASERCRGRTITVVVRYRVERVVRGARAWPRQRALLVAHRCPRRLRGFDGRSRGDAGRMRPGARHRLHLRLLSSAARAHARRWVDPFDTDLPRYRALRTDKAPRRARLAITFEGGAGARQQISFDLYPNGPRGDGASTTDRSAVIVGSRYDADVMLADSAVAPQHLRLEAAGDHTAVIPLGSARVEVNGKPLDPTRHRVIISYKDRLTVGPYTLRVSLLTAAWLDRHAR